MKKQDQTGVPAPSSPSGHSGSAPSPEGIGHSASVPNAVMRLLADQLDQRQREFAIAKQANLALRWLGNYGEQSAKDSAISFGAEVRFASACEGCQQAMGYVEKAALGMTSDIIQLATALAQVDVERAVPASAMSAGTAETPQEAQGEARQRDPQGDAR